MRNTGGIVNTTLGSFDISAGGLRMSNVRAGNHHFPNHSKVKSLLINILRKL
jgi:hypothetical protein